MLLASSTANSGAELPFGDHLAAPLVIVLGSTDGAGALAVGPPVWSFGANTQVLSAGVQVATLDLLAFAIGPSNPVSLTLVDALP